jgi:hypothetical protein
MANIGTGKRSIDGKTSSIPTLALILSMGVVEFVTVGTDFAGLEEYFISGSKTRKECYI